MTEQEKPRQEMLEELLNELRMSGAVLARRLGLNLSTVSRWRNGHSEIPEYPLAYLRALKEIRKERFVRMSMLSDIERRVCAMREFEKLKVDQKPR